MFRDKLESKILNQQFDHWWEQVLYDYIDEDIKIPYLDINGTFWTEVDYIEDYQRLQSWIEGHEG